MTLAEAARVLGVSPRTLRRWARAGRIDGTRTPQGTWLLRRDAVERIARGIEGESGGPEGTGR